MYCRRAFQKTFVSRHLIFLPAFVSKERLRENVKYTAYDMDHKMSVQEACGYDYIAYDVHNLEKFKMLQNEAYTKYK